MQGAPQLWPLGMVAGDRHTHECACTHAGTCCLSPHCAPSDPVSAAGGARETAWTLPSSEGPQQPPQSRKVAREGPHTQPSMGDRRDPPRLLPAQGSTRGPAADATAPQSGLAGMRWSSGRAGSAGSGRGGRSQHPPLAGANTASRLHPLHPYGIPAALCSSPALSTRAASRGCSPLLGAPASPRHSGGLS